MRLSTWGAIFFKVFVSANLWRRSNRPPGKPSLVVGSRPARITAIGLHLLGQACRKAKNRTTLAAAPRARISCFMFSY